jgi:outer membrane receptor protein involved in Fe transport
MTGRAYARAAALLWASALLAQTPSGELRIDVRDSSGAAVEASGLDFLAVSSSFACGNENNLNQPDGVYYLGQSASPGYGVVNLGARYQIFKRLEAFVRINNLLNHKYYTAVQLGVMPYDNNGNFVAPPFPAVDGNYPIRSSTFFAPGTPIDVFGGLKFTF